MPQLKTLHIAAFCLVASLSLAIASSTAAFAADCIPGQVVLVHKFRSDGDFSELAEKVLSPLAEVSQQQNNVFVLSDNSSISRAEDCSNYERICRRLKREANRNRVLPKFSHLECSNDYTGSIGAIPDDESFALQTGLKMIGVEAAWDKEPSAQSQVVAVIDTGVDQSHYDLAGNIFTNPAETPSNGIDDDRNGYVDDVYGYDFVNKDADPADDHGHGTHVAGIIGARGNNGKLFAGVAWEVQILSVKAFNASGRGSLSSVLQALEYVRSLRKSGVAVRVVNASFGFVGTKFPTLDAKLAELEEAEIFVVSAAGNSKLNIDETPTYPASSEGDNVIAVAAVDANGNLASFSNYGEKGVDIAAPGVSIWSLYPRDLYVRMSGTSMATPFVSGAMALLLAQSPNASIAELREALLQGASQFDTLAGLVLDSRFLNVAGAVAALSTPAPAEGDSADAPAEQPTPVPTVVPTIAPTPPPTVEPTPSPTPTPVVDKKKKKKIEKKKPAKKKKKKSAQRR
jgi:subtilisin family serine protease